MMNALKNIHQYYCQKNVEVNLKNNENACKATSAKIEQE